MGDYGLSMKRMKIISLLLVLAMVVSIIPSSYAGHDKPGPEDLREIGSQIEYPKSSEYLDRYHYAIVNASHGHSVFGFGSADHRGKRYTVSDGKAVKILAERVGYSCCIILSLGKACWIDSEYLTPMADMPGEEVQTEAYAGYFNGKYSVSWDHIVSVIVDAGITIGLRSDGRVAFAGDNNSEEIQALASWRNIDRIELQCSYDWRYIIGYRHDGSIALAALKNIENINIEKEPKSKPITEADLKEWKSVAKIRIIDDGCLALCNNGTVLTYLQTLDEYWLEIAKSVSDWSDIVQLEIEWGSMVVGLRADGTIVSAGSILHEEHAALGELTGVVKIIIGYEPGLGTPRLFCLKEDGSCFVYDMGEDAEFMYLPNRESFSRITEIYFAESCLCALRDDGHLCFYTYKESFRSERKLDFYEEIKQALLWDDIVQVDHREDVSNFVALHKDGTVSSLRGRTEDYSTWTEVEKLCCEGMAGIRRDGAILVTEENELKEEIKAWCGLSDCVQSDGYITHAVGLHSDGTVIAAGDNSLGQCNLVVY